MRASRALIAVLGMSLLAYAAYESARRGLDDWQSTRWSHEVRIWAERRAVPSEDQWQRAVDGLRAALRLAPRDPSLWGSLGFAYDVDSTTFVRSGKWHVYDEYALIHFRQAVSLRPTSPYSWAGVAVMKYRLGQLDEELSRALASAMRLGPWEPGVQMMVSELGLALWDRLDPAFKA